MDDAALKIEAQDQNQDQDNERANEAVSGYTDDHDPVTLHRIMQTMIGEGLRERYQAPQKLSHELFVVLLQLKEEEQRKVRRARSVPRKARTLGSLQTA